MPPPPSFFQTGSPVTQGFSLNAVSALPSFIFFLPLSSPPQVPPLVLHHRAPAVLQESAEAHLESNQLSNALTSNGRV